MPGSQKKTKASHPDRPRSASASRRLREPFKRLFDAGLRMNELRASAELHEFLIDEATEISGGERVLLVLESPQGPQLAGAQVPRGENAQALLAAITPALLNVRRTRAVTLDYTPERARELDQRSRIVAPLIAQRQLLGYLYLDIDGAFGRFHDTDRDTIGMLAGQAAVALDNARWSQGLEKQLEQRTEELRASNALLGQRVNELAIINSVQAGMAAELDFQAIIDLVGDTLRDVFTSGDIGIQWRDEEAQLVRYLYVYEHGVRIWPDPTPLDRRSAVTQAMLRRQPLVVNNRAESDALGIGTLPGTDPSLSSVFVPVFSGDRDLGSIALENYQRESAFGDAEVRLLSTVAASMGAALENARLFDETQRLLKETERRAEELDGRQQGHPSRARRQARTSRALIDLVGEQARDRAVQGGHRLRGAGWTCGRGRCEFPVRRSASNSRRCRTARASPAASSIRESAADPQRGCRTCVARISAMRASARARQAMSYRERQCPSSVGGVAQGVISVQSTSWRGSTTRDDQRLLSTIAANVGVALQNARLFKETREALGARGPPA